MENLRQGIDRMFLNRTTQEKQSIRESNIELLRILSLLAIILTHIAMHAVSAQLTDQDLMERFHNGFFCQPLVFYRLLFPEIVLPLGYAANHIFMLISGYYLIKNVDAGKIIGIFKKLFPQIVFAAGVLTVASLLYYKAHRVQGIYVAMTDMSIINAGTWWFVGWYFLVVALGLLVLNRYFNKANRRMQEAILIVLFMTATLGWSGALVDSIGKELRTLLIGIFVYLLGGYIRLYDPFSRLKSLLLGLCIFIVYALIFVGYYNNTKNSAQQYILNGSTDVFLQKVTTYQRYSILPLVLAIIIFELARRINLPPSVAISELGAATFMVYLIHENPFVIQIYKEVDWITMLYESIPQYILCNLAFTVILFAAGFVCYEVYSAIRKGVLSKDI